MNKTGNEHSMVKFKRLDSLPQHYKDFLIGVFESSHGTHESLRPFAEELNVVVPTLVRKVKYWIFRKTNQ